MPNNLQSAFEVFLKDIEPSKTTKSNASQAHTSLRDFLARHESFKDVHVRTFLSGSYKRDTAIRPRKKGDNVDRPDVDIVVVTNHSLEDSPVDVVKLLYDTLSKEYETIRKQQRSVGIETDKADMDVVPVIEPNGQGEGHYIADRKLDEWLETNPPAHTEWTTEVNKKADGRFKPLVKLFKWWRRSNPTVSKKPKGFVLECIVAECMDYTEKNYSELFVGTLEDFVDRYSGHITLGIVPTISDPGVPSNSVTQGMTFDAFKGFYNKVKTHAEIARGASDETNDENAVILWRQVFGDRFPKFGSAVKSSGLLTSAVATNSLSFPDQPIRPNKPEGFA